MMVVTDASGVVLMWSLDGEPTPPEGGRLVKLTDDQAIALQTTPNTCGLSFDGNGFAALPVPPPPTPQQVTPLQMRMALRQMGVIDQVTAYVAQQTPDVQDAWEYASFFPITDPMIVAAAQALKVDLNSLFNLAGSLHP